MSVDPQIVRDWVALQYQVQGSAEYERLFAAYEAVSDMIYDRPEDAWVFILEALKLDRSNVVVEVLSAGPLEDLLVYHGLEMIARIEAEAKENPAFASLLGGVWPRSIDDVVWARVQKARDRRGWDGNSAA